MISSPGYLQTISIVMYHLDSDSILNYTTLLLTTTFPLQNFAQMFLFFQVEQKIVNSKMVLDREVVDYLNFNNPQNDDIDVY